MKLLSWLKAPSSLAAISGFIMWLAFPPNIAFPLIFVALIPILWAENTFLLHKKGVRKSAALGFLFAFTSTVLCTWWVMNAHWSGVVAASIINGIIFSIVFGGFHFIKKHMGSRMGYLAFFTLWIAAEYLQYNWELDFPWLMLGNTFANTPILVQWYEYTGVFGGTLWVLIVNLSLFFFLKYWLLAKRSKSEDKDEKLFLFWSKVRFGFRASILLILPIIISLSQYFSFKDEGIPAEVAVIQPNYDPYNEKFTESNYRSQLTEMLSLTEKVITPKTKMVLWPETSLPGTYYLNESSENWQLDTINLFLTKYPQLALVIGATTLRQFEPGEQLTETARTFNENYKYDVHNAGLCFQYNKPLQVYYKSKLVVGVEKMPFKKFFKLIEHFILDFGGTTGSMGTQDERESLNANGLKVAPIICYESIFGQFVGDYVLAGANFLGIITNDGWWGDTPGYKQHFAFARLRAIETRKYIARSANTGTSGFIDARGNVMQKTDYWVQATAIDTILLNENQTFYTKTGDYLGRFATIIGLILLLVSIVQSKIKKPFTYAKH